jgi:hypothetical protein
MTSFLSTVGLVRWVDGMFQKRDVSVPARGLLVIKCTIAVNIEKTASLCFCLFLVLKRR